MIPVTQTRFGRLGNCLAASIASILECHLEDVPATCGQGWQPPLAAFLSKYGLCYLEVWRGNMQRIETDGLPMLTLGWQPMLYSTEHPLCVLCGPSPRVEGVHHCVVGRSNGYSFEILHDPHPSRAGISIVTHLGFLLPIDAARP